jgi:hypothetical protein
MGRGMLIGACHALRQIASTGSIETITPPCVWQAYRNLIFRRQEEEDSDNFRGRTSSKIANWSMRSEVARV